VSRHWQPDEDRAGWTLAEDPVRIVGRSPRTTNWPQGATAGLLMVAAGCLAIGLLLYKAAGPRDPIARNTAVDWNKVELPRQQ
jgi:hypothetical protein